MAVIVPRRPKEPEVVSSPAAAAPQPQDNTAGIQAAYQKYLGRTAGDSDLNAWLGNNNYEAGIAGSPEAAAYNQRLSGASIPTGSEGSGGIDGRNVPGQSRITPAGSYAYMEGVDAGKLNDQTHTSPKYTASRILASGGTLEQAAQAIGARVLDKTRMQLSDGTVIDTRRDEEGANALQWLIQGGGPGEAAAGAPMGGQSLQGGGVTGTAGFGTQAGGTTTGVGRASGNSVFSDPATTEWEQALRATFDKLNQAQPTWTPAQMELQQTQALDPMEQQRSARKQQAVEYYAARGQQPGHSGIVDQALRDIDKQFDQLRTTTQAGFATQAINREDQVFNNNETRAVNATNLFKQIPQLADTRMASAQGSLQNPLQLIQTLMAQQNNQQNQSAYQTQQDQQFWTQIANALATAFQ